MNTKRAILFFTGLLFAAALLSPSVQAARKKTPSDVYATVELLNRKLDSILRAKGVAAPPPLRVLEKKVGPMHVYQLHLQCISLLREFEAKEGLQLTPLVVSSPMKYTPSDVYMLSEMLRVQLNRDAVGLSVPVKLPRNKIPAYKKTPTDVFNQIAQVLNKLFALNGYAKIKPAMVHAQMVRARKDSQSIVRNIANQYEKDPIKNRFFNAAASGIDITGKLVIERQDGRTPGDVFGRCIDIRKTINDIKAEVDLDPFPVPSKDVEDLRPSDVFIQTQIIISDLNLIKMKTRTLTSTPITIHTEGETPSDVYLQGDWVKLILDRLKSHYEDHGA